MEDTEFPYYEAAVYYFINGGHKLKYTSIDNVVNERFHRTNNGDDIYIALSKLMLDHEYSHEDYKEELNGWIRDIIGPDNPNNDLE